jgi:hypothetical protein
MNKSLRVTLNATTEQYAQLLALQLAFAEACNALSLVVQQTRCWNRVALHHLTYKSLRARFPQLGSQMTCNAIYAVSRTSRVMYQSPESPFNVAKIGDKSLPRISYNETCPVHFDRHTLSVKDRQLSMYTLDGRVRFQLALQPEDENMFHQKKLKEIVMVRDMKNDFELSFQFTEEDVDSTESLNLVASMNQLPGYVVVNEML